MNLMNDMIDNVDPNEDVRKNDTLTELIKTLKGMEDKLRNLIAQLNDENMLSFTLALNDDLNRTLERYEDLKHHRKPAPFKGKEVEPEVLRQIEQLEKSESFKKQLNLFDDDMFGFSGSFP